MNGMRIVYDVYGYREDSVFEYTDCCYVWECRVCGADLSSLQFVYAGVSLVLPYEPEDFVKEPEG